MAAKHHVRRNIAGGLCGVLFAISAPLTITKGNRVVGGNVTLAAIWTATAILALVWLVSTDFFLDWSPVEWRGFRRQRQQVPSSPAAPPEPEWTTNVSVGPGRDTVTFDLQSTIGAQMLNGCACEVKGPWRGPWARASRPGTGLAERVLFTYPHNFPDASRPAAAGRWDVRWCNLGRAGDWEPFLTVELELTQEALDNQRRREQFEIAEGLLKGLYDYRNRVASGKERSQDIRDNYVAWLPAATGQLRSASPDLVTEWEAHFVDPHSTKVSRVIDEELLRAVNHQIDLLEKLRERTRP